MESTDNFFTSLERYVRKVALRSSLPRYWAWMVVGGVLVVTGTSISAQNEILGARNMEEAIRIAARQGDYQIARALFDQTLDERGQTSVLGASAELENLVYPEKKVEMKIAELKQLLTKYPENKDICQDIARLSFEIGDGEQAKVYAEKARILDPNGNDN